MTAAKTNKKRKLIRTEHESEQTSRRVYIRSVHVGVFLTFGCRSKLELLKDAVPFVCTCKSAVPGSNSDFDPFVSQDEPWSGW